MRKLVVCALLCLPVTLTLLADAAYAQQTEIPPAISVGGDPANLGGPSERIVEGRPWLYGVKRYVQPMTWVDAGISPLLRFGDKFYLQGSDAEKKAPKVAGIGVGMAFLGSGSGAGLEVRPFHRNLFGTGTEIELPLKVTYRLYESYGFRVSYPATSDDTFHRLGVELAGRYVSRPSDRFFGIGNDSELTSGARFRSVSRVAAVGLRARLTPKWSVRFEEAYRSVGITHPRTGSSVSDVFPIESIPGLAEAGGIMMMTTAELERDTRSSRVLPDSGGLQRVQVTLNESRSGGDFSYWRYRADLQQFIPISSDHRKVIVFRTAVETNQEKGGGVVPFFDLPTLGSHSTLRGFRSRRFTDKSVMTASLEYRYRIWRHMDWARFADAGQVAPEIGDFDRNGLHTGYGARFIVRGGDRLAVSLEVAHSREAWLLYLDFNPRF
jgi:outer membrane protein assembly factor BamA